MRIGMIAPIWETVPPSGYGGIERIVDLLTRHLLARGHHVTLFATGDSQCEAECAWTEPLALRALGFDTWSSHLSEALHLANAFSRRNEFDLFHNHLGPLGVSFAQACGAPTVTTLHGPILPENERYFRAAPRHPYVSISEAQREGCPSLNYLDTVYNGIETSEFGLGQKQDYLLFLGRISPEKGTHLAIEAAQRAGYPLVLAGKVDPYDQAYFEEQVAHRIDGEHVRFIGEVGGNAKHELIQGARALLHLVQWSEPFGLVMAEALASGTPVIAMPFGSIPEIVSHGVTGFVVESVDEAVQAISDVGAIDPRVCRQEAVRRFDAARMVDGYMEVYERLRETAVIP